MSFGREDPVMKTLHEQMKSYLNKEQQAMEERIRKVEEAEREKFSQLQKKTHSERTSLFSWVMLSLLLFSSSLIVLQYGVLISMIYWPPFSPPVPFPELGRMWYLMLFETVCWSRHTRTQSPPTLPPSPPWLADPRGKPPPPPSLGRMSPSLWETLYLPPPCRL